MPKPTTTEAPPAQSRVVEQPDDVLARVAQARREQDEASPLSSRLIEDEARNSLVRRAGGNFALKRLVIAHVSNVEVRQVERVVDEKRVEEVTEVGADGVERVSKREVTAPRKTMVPKAFAVDPARCREVRVNLHMDRQTYENPQKIHGVEYLIVGRDEVVIQPFEEEYASEKVRDRLLNGQAAYRLEEGQIADRVYLNLGPIDYGKLNAQGGNTWKGQAGLNETIR